MWLWAMDISESVGQWMQISKPTNPKQKCKCKSNGVYLLRVNTACATFPANATHDTLDKSKFGSCFGFLVSQPPLLLCLLHD